jgi:crossover junction endodeoxyribonuclease RuvC
MAARTPFPQGRLADGIAPPEQPAAAIVLGIDPGSVVVGFGALAGVGGTPRLVEAGAIRAPARAAVAQRLGAIRAELDSLLHRLRPSVVVVERAFVGRNIQAALRIGEGRGVVLSAAAAAGAAVVEYPPAVAKKVLIGHGGAHKEQVALMVVQLLGLAGPVRPHDASDALALALTHWMRQSRAAFLPTPAVLGQNPARRSQRWPSP